MATYEDVLAEILAEVIGRQRSTIHTLTGPLRELLGHPIRLEDTLTESEREAWLLTLRQEKARILHWLTEGGHV